MAKPSRPCPTPHCANLQPCSAHPRKPFANAQRSSTLYNTLRWKHESRAFLQANPYCVARLTVLPVRRALTPSEAEQIRVRFQREYAEHPNKMIELEESGLCGAPATVVDHRIPHRGNAAAFWNRGNWAALCKPHHQAKTGRETRARVEGVRR